MTDELKFYQINLNKCEAAQATLMFELAKLKDKEFICLIQEPHFYGHGLKPSSIDKRFMQAFHSKGSKQFWPPKILSCP